MDKFYCLDRFGRPRAAITQLPSLLNFSRNSLIGPSQQHFLSEHFPIPRFSRSWWAFFCHDTCVCIFIWKTRILFDNRSETYYEIRTSGRILLNCPYKAIRLSFIAVDMFSHFVQFPFGLKRNAYSFVRSLETFVVFSYFCCSLCSHVYVCRVEAFRFHCHLNFSG